MRPILDALKIIAPSKMSPPNETATTKESSAEEEEWHYVSYLNEDNAQHTKWRTCCEYIHDYILTALLGMTHVNCQHNNKLSH